jgi:hypothetical protein
MPRNQTCENVNSEPENVNWTVTTAWISQAFYNLSYSLKKTHRKHHYFTIIIVVDLVAPVGLAGVEGEDLVEEWE